MILTILIPSLISRTKERNELIKFIESHKDVMVHSIIDNGDISTGLKRNSLIMLCKTPYLWFVDDDDEVPVGAIDKIVQACKFGSDMIGINGYMTTNGRERIDWEIRRDHPYDKAYRNGIPYYRRFANHITPMKTEIARQIKFEDLNYQEDYRWACKLKDSGLIKTETVVEDFVYHYKFTTNK